MIYYILFGILVIIFIISIVLSSKLYHLRHFRISPCNTSLSNNIIDEYNEMINDFSMQSKPIKPKKIQFDNNVKVRVFG
jgi:hypothetical protein